MQDTVPRRLKLLETQIFALNDEAMLLSELDGFLAGILVCPDLIMPSEWMPIIWGGDADNPPSFENTRQFQKLSHLIMEHYNAVAIALQNSRYTAIFDFDPRHDETLWEVWIEGFARAMDLRPQSWSSIPLVNVAAHAALTGLTALIEISSRDSHRPDKEIGKLTQTAPDLIPGWIEDLHACRIERHLKNSPISDMRSFTKVGRNEPCTCGSGKKYKKCCRLN